MVRPVCSPAWLLLVVAACGPSPGTGDDDDDGPPTDASVGLDDGYEPTPDGPPGGNAAVFAHTADALFRIHPQTYQVTRVGAFAWPPGITDQLTDLAIDQDGVMIGVSYQRVYRIDPQTAACTLLSASLGGMFNGLSFVPSELALGTPGPDVLVGLRNTDGKIFRIDPSTGTPTQIGDMGPGYVSSGDIVAVTGFGMVATVPTGTVGPDRLVRLAPVTFAATPIGADTGFDNLWGVGFWGGRVFGFTDQGDLAIIDSATGAGSRVSTGGEPWWGAAVTTAAPVID